MFADAAPWLNYALDWANLLLRWAHVVVAIAWIGSSFYFVWLDNSLTPPPDPALREKGVGGELWAVHGGGFYNPQKYLGAPKKVPAHLHWFYWESYSTWLTGFALFTVLYLFNAGTYLIDKSVFNWTPMAAVTTALLFLVGFWAIYDVICRTVGRKPEGNALVGALVFGVVIVAAWLASQLFAGRAAFLLVGAMMATTMSANVFFWIIPGQRTVVETIKAGQPVDPVHGQRGKQRSVHNTYFTMPVLIAMLSNHYSWVYTHEHNWLALVLLMLAGALIRHFFVARHKTEVAGTSAPWHWAGAGCAVLLGVVIWLAPAPRPAAVAKPAEAPSAPVVSAPMGPLLSQVNGIVQQRCVMCHNADLANKGVMLHTPELITKHQQQIYQQVVMLRAMPMNNATRITEEERGVVAQWFKAGLSGR
ncbi:MAG: hypothetical protein C0487_02175 [Leptothrix sp. (in: Bacteria)]|nr:hypothetical protein [Leptothrix sp. (in: b-proteobacteria)]